MGNQSIIKNAIIRLIAGQDLSKTEAFDVMNFIMEGSATDAQIGAYLIALRLKGETVAEISGSSEAMALKADPFKIKAEKVVDTCGTGGDNLHTFNISTTAAFIAAGAGVKIAKHGNRSVSSQCGSADILKSFGVNIDLPNEKFVKVFDKVGLAFLFAPLYHKAMKYAIGPRREIGVRTIFNVLGPLTNPAGTKRQVIGVFSKELCRIIAEVMQDRGAEHVLVVHGSDGLDEITITGDTTVCELKEGAVTEYTVHPADFGLKTSPLNAIQSPDCAANKTIITDILNAHDGSCSDVAILNAAASIYVSGRAASLQDSVQIARESIVTGKALKKLEELIQHSNA